MPVNFVDALLLDRPSVRLGGQHGLLLNSTPRPAVAALLRPLVATASVLLRDTAGICSERSHAATQF